ncbi:MAG: hypothetical protein H7A46_10130 [Verrucomicrobiales bacterium]|nr:hypothetical protein [Verrucomicrobiales bacterium]
MKKKGVNYGDSTGSGAPALRDATAAEVEPMVRTQVYLTRREHEFLTAEAGRLGRPMAAVLRSFIDEKMEIPDEVWDNNPLLAPPVEDPDWVGHEDGAINHDHYIYGCPKKWVKKDGEWVEAPPLPDDYYENPASSAAYDRMLEGMS